MLRKSILSFAVLSLLVGCGSSETPGPAGTTDTGSLEDVAVDTAQDSAPPADTGTDSGSDTGSRLVCETELPSSFACTAPTKTPGQTACTEAALQEFVEKCINADITVPAECAAWKTANAACASCVSSWSWDGIEGAVYPDDYKCYWSTFDASCATKVNCLFACEDEVCGGCEDEALECYSNNEKAGGQCWDIAGKDATNCFDTTNLTGCDISELYEPEPSLPALKNQMLRFYRGACRDNGNWTNAASGGDAGVSDAGDAGDSAVSDAADAD